MSILFTFKKFPVSICTQTGELTNKEKLIEAQIIEDESGAIHFTPYVDPKDIYLSQHNNCVGETWENHNLEFTNFVYEYEKESITEIAGGSGKVFLNFKKQNPDYKKWKVIDINPSEIYYEDSRNQVIEGLYEGNMIDEGDVVISSHFVEHIPQLDVFLQDLRLRNPKYHIFTLPNFKKFSSSHYTATIMFEHPHYLSEDYLDYFLERNGWKVVNKYYYRNHSIFYITEPSEVKNNDQVFNNTSDITNLVEYMRKRAKNITQDKFYVFGAHLTYYYLLNLGIDENRIIAVVDNDPNKQGKRMYGTNTKVISPQELEEGANVFVEMGPYNEEIIKGLNNVKNKINYI